jgi:hypothetical protein
MTEEMIVARSLPWICLTLSILVSGGCASTQSGWREAFGNTDLQVLLREYPASNIPEFRADILIQSSLANVMYIMTDIGGWTDWLFGARSVEIIQDDDFNNVILYQVTALPLIRDRDMLVHASIIVNDPGQAVTIKVESVPDYCLASDLTSCRVANDSTLVRVNSMKGEFRLRQVENAVRVTWQQHLDPGGALPDWITRLMLVQVPKRSLMTLKRLAE